MFKNLTNYFPKSVPNCSTGCGERGPRPPTLAAFHDFVFNFHSVLYFFQNALPAARSNWLLYDFGFKEGLGGLASLPVRTLEKISYFKKNVAKFLWIIIKILYAMELSCRLTKKQKLHIFLYKSV